MEFTTPTTKEQMYSILKDIFYYYRIRKAEFEQQILQPIVLNRLEFTPLTDEQLLKKAEDLILFEQQSEIIKIRAEISQDIDQFQDKLQELTKAYNLSVEKVLETYNQSVVKIQEDSIKRGVGMTSIVTGQLNDLENMKNQQLSHLEQEFLEDSGYYTLKIQELNSRYENISTEYEQIFENQKKQKYIVLKDEQDKIIREIFKYNNGLDEKEQRSVNSIAQSNATLKLKYMEISSENFTKDQLIEMGYYQDVIDCVCAYYDRFSALEAWRNITNDSKVAIYLEEYYTQIVYMYQQRAGAV